MVPVVKPKDQFYAIIRYFRIADRLDVFVIAARGFSQNACLPWFIAYTATSGMAKFGVQTMIASTSFTNSFQSL